MKIVKYLLFFVVDMFLIEFDFINFINVGDEGM